MPTKANFKATRERIGYTQQWVARTLGVGIKTVKRWEQPNQPEPPVDAWDWLLGEAERFDDMLEFSVRKAVDSGAGNVVLTYYRTQEQYDQCGRDEGSYGFANALARAVGYECEYEGLEVEYRYPDDGAIRTEGSRY